MKAYMMTETNLQDEANSVYSNVIDALFQEGFLSLEQANNLTENYTVITINKFGRLHRFLKKWLGKTEPDTYAYRLVKIVGTSVVQTEEKETK